MTTEQQFADLLTRSEGETLDFKMTAYDLSSDDSKRDLIKDVLCMANTPRDETSYLILGVKKYPDGHTELVGLDKHLDDADLQSQFNDRVFPVPNFFYEPIHHGGKCFGLIAIPPDRRGPYMLAKDLFDSAANRNKLQRGKIYFRQQSQNKVALQPHEITRIVLWCSGQASRPHYEVENAAWTDLLEAVGRFEASRSYVLVCCEMDRKVTGNLEALADIPWSAIVDFDPESETQGFFSAAASTLRAKQSLHVVMPEDRLDSGLGRATYWYFARGGGIANQTAHVGSFKSWITERALRISRNVTGRFASS